ncbi:hypothetical protein K438DRAFT_2000433 [Mycena galopus ATCC 62051]|nr:hypothetical protein K438DRAFT_2000433 [Mycena galopus ATCC 62051]
MPHYKTQSPFDQISSGLITPAFIAPPQSLLPPTTASYSARVLPTPPTGTARTVTMKSRTTASNSSSYSLSTPLPSPVSPSSLTVETPSLGDALLPRPKRGAPPVAPALPPKKKTDPKEEHENKPLDPALCEGW